MSISAEEKVCYLREAAIVLAKEGFQLDEVHTDRLCILLDGAPLCEVTENGGITYRNEDIMLSYITLYPENWQRHSYVACCGTSIQPVLQMLEQAPQLDTVLLCLDNDETGHQASRRMREQLEMRYSVERLIPESKDWNDDLTLSIENAQGFAMNEMR